TTQVGVHHHRDQFLQAGLGRPAQFGARLGRVSEQYVDFRRTEEIRVDHQVVFDLQADVAEGDLAHVAHGGGLAGGDDVIVGFGLLGHQPHRLDVIAGEAPVALGVDVAQAQFLLLAQLDPGDRVGDLAGDELDAAQRRLVVEQDAAGGVDLEALAVVDRGPVRHQLGHAVGAARIERGLFVLHFGLDQAEHLAGRSLVETRLRIDDAHRFQHVERADAVDLCGQQRLLPGAADEALRAEVVDLVGLGGLHRADHRRQVGQVAVEQAHLSVDAEFAQAPQGVGAAPRQHAVHLVPLVEQQLGKVGAVLAGDAGDECCLVIAHVLPLLLQVCRGELRSSRWPAPSRCRAAARP
ncbi:hypothetical protein CATMIT_01671, partial [Catenibacterium mitsuokai DSM 15897]